MKEIKQSNDDQSVTQYAQNYKTISNNSTLSIYY